MTLTFAIAGQPQEGGPLVLTVTSDTPGFTFRLDSSLVYTASSKSSTYGPGGDFEPTGSVQTIHFRLYDNSTVDADVPFTLTGKATLGLNGFDPPTGPSYSFSLSGVIKDNDSSAFTIDVSDPATVYVNLLRFTPADFFPAYFDRTYNLALPAPIPRELIHALPNIQLTTDVAVMAYQFFTGKIPYLSGLSYLLDPSVNPNSLNSSYYASFNQENRYINFAANLGLNGEGSATFRAAYGGLSMHDAVVKAYTQVVGSADADAVASIEAATPYFQAIAQQRIGGPDLDLAAKAVMVGYVLEEAVKAHVGVYAQALDNFLLDLSDGSAMTGVSLIGTYGPGTFVDAQNR